jgi:hypothetical protein
MECKAQGERLGQGKTGQWQARLPERRHRVGRPGKTPRCLR